MFAEEFLMTTFTKPIEQYSREYNTMNVAMGDLVETLVVSKNISREEAAQYVMKVTLPDGAFPPKNPEVLFLRRKPNGDRVAETTNLKEYLEDKVERNLIIAPNLTIYERPEVRKSILAEYIQVNLQFRKNDKKEMFENDMRAKSEETPVWERYSYKKKAAYFKTLQESRKIKNNSLSGMHASPSTIGYNKSSHSSLTALCRCATSYANASNEKFLGGLRHYYAPTIIYNNILTSNRSCDMAAIDAVMIKYSLHYPSTDEVMEGIEYSTQYYWKNSEDMLKIRNFIDGLTPTQKAAFLYVGDLYHFDLYNSEFTQKYIATLGAMDTTPQADPESIIDGLDDNYKAISTLLCTPLIKGILLKDAKKQKPEAYNAVAATAVNMQKTVEDYSDFIQAIIVQPYLPTSIAQFPNSKRKSVPTSDTDSTIFTCQYWVDKYGDVRFSDKAMSVMYVMVFMISSITQNTLMKYSANLGVSPEHLKTINMKNEYIFPVYVLTALAKHYFAYILAKEGNVYNELDIERKGVNLRSSNSPKYVNEQAEEYMALIMNVVLANNKWTSQEALGFVAGIEQQIYDDVIHGAAKLLNTVQVKPAESYSQGEGAAAFQSYLFWNKYFGAKYGQAQTPPYRAIKVAVNLNNKTQVAAWLAGIEDPSIRAGLEEWVTTNNKSNVTIFRIPRGNVAEHGIPKEILDVVDIRGIIKEVTKPLYLVLESLGLYFMNKKGTRIVLDEFRNYPKAA